MSHHVLAGTNMFRRPAQMSEMCKLKEYSPMSVQMFWSGLVLPGSCVRASLPSGNSSRLLLLKVEISIQLWLT